MGPGPERHVRGTKATYAQDADYRARESARRRAYHQAHKDEISTRRQGGHLQRRYGISRADYAALLASQGGVCAICAKPATKTLCVDHCHSTGRIRGLLCRKCNFGLGCYAEDQAAMIAALAYLGGGAFDRDGSGSAARHALLARAALPPGAARVAVLTQVRSLIPFDAVPSARSAGIGERTSAVRPIMGDVLLPSSSRAQPDGVDMSIHDIPPEDGKTTRPNITRPKTTRPMREALDAELRRESDDGDGPKAAMLQLIARKLAAKAVEGDLAAIKEIFDRMDGKSVAGAAADEPQGRVVFQWKDPE
jgi:Autographiviridae endonuclease VII